MGWGSTLLLSVWWLYGDNGNVVVVIDYTMSVIPTTLLVEYRKRGPGSSRQSGGCGWMISVMLAWTKEGFDVTPSGALF
jgi:hypothetical protein